MKDTIYQNKNVVCRGEGAAGCNKNIVYRNFEQKAVDSSRAAGCNKNIVYRSPNDLKRFDFDKFVKSVSRYAKVTADEVRAALEPFAGYETLHVSCLVEAGAKLIADKAGEKAMRAYVGDHATYLGEGKFERLRRITGYLVGTLDRWNDAKKAEEAARVKHSVNSAVDDAERLVALETQAMEHNIAYAQ